MEDSELVNQILSLYRRCKTNNTSPRRRRLVWTNLQDELLFAALREHGPKWRKLSKALDVSDDAIRNRVYRLDNAKLPDDIKSILGQLGPRCKRTVSPSKVCRPYSAAEDSLIVKALSNGLNSWVKIQADFLPRRTTHSIRNRAYRIGVALASRSAESSDQSNDFRDD